MALFWLLFVTSLIYSVCGKGSESLVECTPDLMTVKVPMDGNRKISYLDQLKDYKPCAPILENNIAVYNLNLDDPHRCGVTRIINKITGKRTFYHKIVVEDSDESREIITVRCSVGIPIQTNQNLPIRNDTFGIPTAVRYDRPAPILGEPHAIAKRASSDLPLGFQEPETLDISKSFTGAAPEPQLGVAVKQNGKKVSGEISVSPGTPLSMEIFLDNNSAPVYGLLVGYMQVTDTKQQRETIIFNGCSIDPYLFDNFVTDDGDVLRAKFRAFKFPDTNYVQFQATVTVCLDKCQGVSCSNGAIGYGKRRRRSIDKYSAPNRIYEVSLTTFIKVGDDKEAEDVLNLIKNLQVANQMLENKNSNVAPQSPNNAHVAYVTEGMKNQNGARQNQDVGLNQDGGTQVAYVAEKMQNKNLLYTHKNVNNASQTLYASCFSLILVLATLFTIYRI